MLTAVCFVFWILRYDGKSGDEESNEADKKSEDTSHESKIWLSIVGEVYDVTAGKEFYKPGSSYNVFAGRDASTAFVTGKFTAEESAQPGLDTLTIKELPGLETWRVFYQDDPKYKFVGKLIDPRYYNEDGTPTEPLIEYRERLKTALVLQEQEREARKLKQQERKKKLQSGNKAKQTQKVKSSTTSTVIKPANKQRQQQKAEETTSGKEL